MNHALPAVFFLSGAAALVFQTLWFRLAGLVFGNSVWASSLVLASFMAGVALGNALVARHGHRVRRPLVGYAVLEVIVAVAGLALVVGLPLLTGVLAPVFRALAAFPAAVDALRLGSAFLLMLVPATAMGATLPLLVGHLTASGALFGPALGRLYGWNTLGAVAGALGGEMALIPRFGLLGSGVAAGLLDVVVATVVLVLARGAVVRAPAPAGREAASPLQAGAWRLYLAATLSGGILLGLEVIWFRFLLLWIAGTATAFAIMLAVVLLGIAVGGFAASAWLTRHPLGYRTLPLLALVSGLCVLAGYAGFEPVLRALGADYIDSVGADWSAAALCLWLMLPCCIVSGVLFTFTGRALADVLESDSLTAGALTFCNTAGAASGAILAGFVLLPNLGVEASLGMLALAYLAVAAASAGVAAGVPRQRRVLLAGFAVFGVAFTLFPWGLMRDVYVPRVAARFATLGRPLAVREGLTDTLLYLRNDMLGQPISYWLVTNGFGMASTGFFAERYMNQFAYWPLALKPDARRALLISYGLGSTARALVQSTSLEAIDVVDISADVLEMGRLTTPGREAHPLDDPRVRTHVEDGRFFLLTTSETFDVVTAEPPPPGMAGVVNLYSREYFQLIHARLRPGGAVTHWLPVYMMQAPAARAIVRGFCDVFPDCTLWTGSGLNWMLAGTREPPPAVTEASLQRTWHEGAFAAGLRHNGFETPAHMAATFVADATFLGEFTAGVAPLTDDRPGPLSHTGPATGDDLRMYFDLMDTGRSRARFERSAWATAAWPEETRRRAPAAFAEIALFNSGAATSYAQAGREQFRSLYRALTETGSVMLPLVIAGSDPRQQAAAEAADAAAPGTVRDYLLAVGHLANRHYGEAAALFARVREAEPGFARVHDFEALALCLGGDRQAARRFLGEQRQRGHHEARERPFWAELEARCAAE